MGHGIKNYKEGIRYFLMDMTHSGYRDAIAHFLEIHISKEVGNKLTVLPNINNDMAIVKLSGHEGWIEEEQESLDRMKSSGLIVSAYTYNDLIDINTLLASSDWPQEEE